MKQASKERQRKRPKEVTGGEAARARRLARASSAFLLCDASAAAAAATSAAKSVRPWGRLVCMGVKDKRRKIEMTTEEVGAACHSACKESARRKSAAPSTRCAFDWF